VKIRQLLRGVDATIRGNRELEIRGISSDSRTVAPGDLFLARKGEKHDGSQLIPQAMRSGAVAVVTDLFDPSLELTQIIGKPEKIEGKLASHFYRSPSKELFCVGVTGSKGKTTTTYLIRHLLGETCGLIGTVETILGQERRPSTLTTHEALYNHKALREMIHQKCTSAVLEVSSIGLAQNRLAEIDFSVGLFTNLFPDHLDFHGTIEEYAKAKRLLFKQVTKKAIFNADSSWSRFMQEGLSVPALTFGIETPADLKAEKIEYTPQGTTFLCNGVHFQTPLIGRHNVYNLLGAIAVGLQRNFSLETMAKTLSAFQNAPGRLERIANTKGIEIFVDYAHTGESLQNVLKALREIAPRKLIVLFGCGGNRDPARRPGMAQAAEQFADLCIITTDNPRNESPEEIVRQILEGFTNRQKAHIEMDRKKAIAYSLSIAEPGDILLIAGKGHERVQIFGNQTVPFDDIAVVKSCV